MFFTETKINNTIFFRSKFYYQTNDKSIFYSFFKLFNKQGKISCTINQLIQKLIQMEKTQMQPFRQFFDKMNRDLRSWLQNENTVQQLLEDYTNTLHILEADFECEKIMVDLGDKCFLKVKKINNKIILRLKEDLYVELSKSEALPITKQLITLHNDKLKVCRTEICKIMASMREMESLIMQYQTYL